MVYRGTKKSKVYITFIFALVTALWAPVCVQAMQGQGIEKRLYAGMKYTEVFDQQRVLASFPDVLEQEGLPVVEFTPEQQAPEGRLKKVFHYLTCYQCRFPRYSREEQAPEGCLKKIFHYLTCYQFLSPKSSRTRRRNRDGYAVIRDNDDDVRPEATAAVADDGIDDSIGASANSGDIVINMGSQSEGLDEGDNFSEELDAALVRDYKARRKYAMMRVLREILFSMGIDIGFFAGGTYFLKSKNNKNETTGSGFSGFVLVNVLANSVKNLSRAGYSIYFSPLADSLERYEILYAKRKRFLPRALQEAIEDKFGVARHSDQALDSVVKFLRIALNLPLTSKPLKTLLESREEVEELLEGYDPPGAAEKIKLKFFNHYRRFSRRFTPIEYTPKSVLYLQGPPGVGKTYIIEELAKLMGAPLIKLMATEDVASIIGSEDKPGSFLEDICRPEVCRNAIVLIDEIDHVVNKKNSALQLFLPLLNPMEEDFASPFLRAKTKIKFFLFVACGNSAIENEALKARLTIVELKSMKKALKKRIVYKMIPENLLSDEALTGRIDALIEADDHPGVKELQGIVTDEIRRLEMRHYEYDLRQRYAATAGSALQEEEGDGEEEGEVRN